MSAATLCTPEAVREVMNTLSPDLHSHNQLLGLMQDHVCVVADAAPRPSGSKPISSIGSLKQALGNEHFQLVLHNAAEHLLTH